MILTKLKEYADTRMDLPPEMYGEGFVRWLIDIDSDGKLVGVISLGGDKDNKFGIRMVTPQVPPVGNGIKPRLLVDTGERVFGIPKAKSNPKRVAIYHQSFKDLANRCADETKEVSVIAISKFLQAWNPELDVLNLPSDFDPNHVVTFRCGEVIPSDAKSGLYEVEKFWSKNAISGSKDKNDSHDSPIMTCLVTGKSAPVAQRMPVPIKGIPGKRPELALVSANSKVFTSYGLENSLSSPISYRAGEYFAKALNSLIADERSRIYIGSTVYVYWTKEKIGFNPFSMLKQPKAEEVEALLKSPFTAQQASGLTNSKVNQFYALALTANNARAVVRDWLETTINNVQEHLQKWFRHQQIVDAYGASPRPLSICTLAASVYRDASKEMQPSAPTTLMRNALHGDRIPEDLLTKLVQRNRVEHEITYPRAVLLKLIFSSNSNREEMMTNMEQLNLNPCLEGNDRAAYFCGRLLAVLETIQRSAIGSIKAPLIDRYYGAASSTPAVAFPQLLRGARAHFSKLRKERVGTYKALEEQIEEITTNIHTFPKTLNLQQQGLFGLGYYHQRASDRASAKARSEAKKLEQATAS